MRPKRPECARVVGGTVRITWQKVFFYFIDMMPATERFTVNHIWHVFFSSLCLLLTVIKEFSIDLTLNSCNIMMDIQTNSSSRIRYTLHSLVPTLPIMPRELWQFGQRFGCGMLVAASLELLSSEKGEEVWLHTSFLWMVQFPNIGSCFSNIGVFICLTWECARNQKVVVWHF